MLALPCQLIYTIAMCMPSQLCCTVDTHTHECRSYDVPHPCLPSPTWPVPTSSLPSLPPPLCRYAIIHNCNCWEGDANKRPSFNMLADKIGCLVTTPEAEYVWQIMSSHDFHVTPILFVCFSVLHLSLQQCLCVLSIVLLTAVIACQPLISACCNGVSNLHAQLCLSVLFMMWSCKCHYLHNILYGVLCRMQQYHYSSMLYSFV